MRITGPALAAIALGLAVASGSLIATAFCVVAFVAATIITINTI